MHTSMYRRRPIARFENQRVAVPVKFVAQGVEQGSRVLFGTIDCFSPGFNTRYTSKRGMYIPGPCNNCLPTQRAQHVFVPCFFCPWHHLFQD